MRSSSPGERPYPKAICFRPQALFSRRTQCVSGGNPVTQRILGINWLFGPSAGRTVGQGYPGLGSD
jgi:hypothetical protein